MLNRPIENIFKPGESADHGANVSPSADEYTHQRSERALRSIGEICVNVSVAEIHEDTRVTGLPYQASLAATTLDQVTVSVNVSARQFARDDCGATVRQALPVSGLSPAQRCLELTESALLDAIGPAAATFAELRQLGVRLADVTHLDVIAEVIETAGQRDLLREMGCHYGQGHYLSRPSPPWFRTTEGGKLGLG
ncbi:EAL domain-containing protein [Cryobacterium sp. Hh11]|uniref:EAL domain-containing protein n=1 Tax=Cryobacterium sp. Hh11 TaxID=2555868 RepID=UPI00141A93F1|nr:EAL domain-containing protein [Cryobacterium sp. Hh11]